MKRFSREKLSGGDQRPGAGVGRLQREKKVEAGSERAAGREGVWESGGLGSVQVLTS